MTPKRPYPLPSVVEHENRRIAPGAATPSPSPSREESVARLERIAKSAPEKSQFPLSSLISKAQARGDREMLDQLARLMSSPGMRALANKDVAAHEAILHAFDIKPALRANAADVAALFADEGGYLKMDKGDRQELQRAIALHLGDDLLMVRSLRMFNVELNAAGDKLPAGTRTGLLTRAAHAPDVKHIQDLRRLLFVLQLPQFQSFRTEGARGTMELIFERAMALPEPAFEHITSVFTTGVANHVPWYIQDSTIFGELRTLVSAIDERDPKTNERRYTPAELTRKIGEWANDMMKRSPATKLPNEGVTEDLKDGLTYPPGMEPRLRAGSSTTR